MFRKNWLVLSFIVLGLALVFLLFPIQEVRNGEGWKRSYVSLVLIAQGLQQYRQEHGRLPPPVVRDKDGRSLYSWRVLLLPYLDYGMLYQEFKLEESWDSPHNKPLLTFPGERTPRCYVPALGNNDPPGLTRYQAFLGPGTAFERDGLPTRPSDAIWVVEATEPVPWSKPVDLVYDPNDPLPPLGGQFTMPTKFLGYELNRKPGFLAAFADGSVRFIASDTDERTIRGYISRGE
jgi:hypothetical protein